MKKRNSVFILVATLACFSSCSQHIANTPGPLSVYQYDGNLEPRWSSPENLNGGKGAGGKENNGAKGHPNDSIPSGASRDLLNIRGQGVINRIWLTINDRSPEMLRSLKIEMYWDGQQKPAVSAPLGDFFGMGLGKMQTFENVFFASPEGRSFTCFIPMPFKQAARIVIINESAKQLHDIFFDVDYSLVKAWNNDNLYFHAYWHRDTATSLTKDFELLPKVEGRGRFLGVNIGVNGNKQYHHSWFGEGEVKIYLDGDTNYPTLNGTGTEDYIGTGWGQDRFINRYTGCTLSDGKLLQYAFYRFHVQDPIFFKTDCKVVIQQLGGMFADSVATYQKAGSPLIVVGIAGTDGKYRTYYKPGNNLQLNSPGIIKGWANFYRRDDVSSTAYFYTDDPAGTLPGLQAVNIRQLKLRKQSIDE